MFVGTAVCCESCITEYKQGVLCSGRSVKQSRFTARCGEDIYRFYQVIIRIIFFKF
jgi:hypothetical protein